MHNALAIYIQDSFPSYYSHPQLFQPEGCHQPSYSGVLFVNLALLGWACQRKYQEDGNTACLLGPAGNQSGGGGSDPSYGSCPFVLYWSDFSPCPLSLLPQVFHSFCFLFPALLTGGSVKSWKFKICQPIISKTYSKD